MADQGSATLFLGPPNDMETLRVRRDTFWGATLDEVVIHAVENMPKNRRHGAYVEIGINRLEWRDIEARYREIRPGQAV